MRKSIGLSLCLLLALAVGAALAGEGKCEHDAQACLNYLAKAYKDKGWAGVEMDESGGSPAVTKVHPGTPAAKANVKIGDVLVAVNGLRLGEENKEALRELWGEMKAGRTFTYTVERDGKERDLKLTLIPMSQEVLAAMVGRHMLEDHATVEVASN